MTSETLYVKRPTPWLDTKKNLI